MKVFLRVITVHNKVLFSFSQRESILQSDWTQGVDSFSGNSSFTGTCIAHDLYEDILFLKKKTSLVVIVLVITNFPVRIEDGESLHFVSLQDGAHCASPGSP